MIQKTARVIYRIRVILFLALIISFGLPCKAETPGSEKKAEVWVALVRDTINPMVADYLVKTIRNAEESSVDCLIIELDTPGGVLESTREIVKAEMNARIPVVVYVSPRGARAASAGVFITLAAHVAAMAPATNIGAAHPVALSPGSGFSPLSPGKKDTKKEEKKNIHWKPQSVADDEVMQDKIMNDLLAWAKTIAEHRGRNVQWLQDAIEKSHSSTEKEALEAGAIDIVCNNRDDLIKALEGRSVELPDGDVSLHLTPAHVTEKPMTLRERFFSTIINPTLAIYLMILGMLGIYVELTHPGFILPGVAGGISIILALYAMHTLPINYAGLFLILLSFAFFIAEVKVTSYGVLTVGGIVAFLLGASMLVDARIPGMEVSMGAIIPLAIATAAITIFLVTLVVRTHTKRSLTADSGMIGEIGKVTKTLKPEGQIFVHGELWKAESKDGIMISEGKKVKIVGTEGLKVFVIPVENHSLNKEVV